MFKMIITTSIFSLGASGALALPNGPHEMGHDGRPGPMHLFEMADTNGDDQISTQEARAARANLFDRLDENENGFLDKSERKFPKFKHRKHTKKHGQKRKSHRKMAADTNQDGVISWDEFSNARSPLFDRLDTNHDGIISKTEHLAAKKRRFAKFDINQDGQLDKADRTAAKTEMQARRKERRAKLDANQDGRISRTEFIAVNGPLMDHCDVNKDGIVTRDEVRTAPKPRPNRH